MKNKSFIILILLFSSFFTQKTIAQNPINNSPDQEVNTVQLTVMIVPFRKDSQDYRRLYDESKAMQLAIDRLKEGFDNRGFQVVDFVSAYDNAMTDRTIASIKNPDDALTAIARSANADIMITVDVFPLMKSPTFGNSVTVRINAVDASTNYSYGTKLCVSPSFNTEDSLALITRAISKGTGQEGSAALEDFLNKLQSNFTVILQKGRPLKVIFGVGNTSMHTFSFMIDGQPLSVLINDWIKANAYKNYSQMQSVTDVSMIYNDVRVPIKDNHGMNYSPFDFGSKITAFLVSKKLKVIQPYMRLGALYVTIN